MKKPYVFISYSSKESDEANLVHSYLEGNGIPCWIASRNIEGGESFAAQIVDAIYGCSVFILMASAASNNSGHVGNELSMAYDQKKKIIPFRLNEFELSKTYIYYFQQMQWIDAYGDMNAALKKLLEAVQHALPQFKETATPLPQPKPTPTAPKEEKDTAPALSREEMVNLLLNNIEKFPYCLKSRTRGEQYESFKQKAKTLFDHTLTMYYRGKVTSGGLDYVDIIVDTLSRGNGIAVQVKGLPGCAKNMLLQLAYYKMLEAFRRGESNYLPIYISSSYYEKISYTLGKERQEMAALIQKESEEFFRFVHKNPEVHPVLMVEAVREHVVSPFAPDDVIMDLWQKFGKFNRIVAVDVGLIKNRQRLKRTIPLMGDGSGYTFRFHSIPLADRTGSLAVIRTVLEMYEEQYDGLEPLQVYKALTRLRFTTLDVFTVRLVATELALGRSAEDISLNDMYERLALNELKNDEEKMLSVARELYEYLFNERHNVKNQPYNAVLWSLPHKHNTYLEYMVAYCFSHKILEAENDTDRAFLNVSMTSMANHFMSSRLCDNYLMQETLLKLIQKEYGSYNQCQKSNAAYWLGKLTYADLSQPAVAILEEEFRRLKPLVKEDNSPTLENRHRQYLFRSVCYGLIAQGRTNAMDEYLCLVVINDVANAINRGTMIDYLGDSHRLTAHNDYYLDTDPNIGEQAIRILCSMVEAKLADKRAGYVEPNLITLLTLVQARMHIPPEKLAYNLSPICEKCLALMDEYYKRPRNIVSEKLLFYFRSVTDDLRQYAEHPRFDAAFTLFTALNKMKETKRSQWLEIGIEDPESIAEHTLSAWMMAMIFLPDHHSEVGYSKQEIMDMLMVHDMAEAILGDCGASLCEPTKELKEENTVIRKLFMKGTYPEVSNMTRFYNVWVGYYNGQNINSRLARDINLIQTVNTFFTYCAENPEQYDAAQVKQWLTESNKLSTDLGYDLFDRIIANNPAYRSVLDREYRERK